MPRARKPIRSAGAVVLADDEGSPQVLIVHRRRQRDWTLPKGRVRPLERPHAAARREAWEETGVRCADGRRVLDVAWRDRHGRPRRIDYWLLEPSADEGFEPSAEVAAIAWVPAGEAVRLLGSARDRRAVRRGVALTHAPA